MLNATSAPATLRLVCSACDHPFIAMRVQACSLPLCGRCQSKANRLTALPINGLSSHEQRELARSILQLANKLRRVTHA